MALVISHQVYTNKAISYDVLGRGTCRRGSGQLPEESDSPRPVAITCPWASEGTGPAAVGCLHIRSLEHLHLHLDTHPAEKPHYLMNFLRLLDANL